jgi:hypothetical protein
VDSPILLSPLEALGVVGLLWDPGSALKETTGDPGCIAPTLYAEASAIENEVGLPPWPTNATTSHALADFYATAAHNLTEAQPSSDASQQIAIRQVRLNNPNGLVHLIELAVSSMGVDGISTKAVSVAARAVALTSALSVHIPGGLDAREAEARARLAALLDGAAESLRRDA